MINFNILIDLFIPDWPSKNQYDYNKLKYKIKTNLINHYRLVPKILKLVLTIIFIFFLIYLFIIKFFVLISFKNLNEKKMINLFFSFTKITNNFERFFRSLISLYFYEIIDKNLINE